MLELTVAHLRRLAAHRPGKCFADSECYRLYIDTMNSVIRRKRGGILSASSFTGDGRQQFREGYQRCQEEVLMFLGRTAAVQPHVAERLWQQLHLTSVSATRHDTPSVPGLDKHPAARKLCCASGNGAEAADPPRITLEEDQPQSRSIPTKKTVPSRNSCRPNPTAPRHASYAHIHWKKCLKPRTGACIWRPW